MWRQLSPPLGPAAYRLPPGSTGTERSITHAAEQGTEPDESGTRGNKGSGRAKKQQRADHAREQRDKDNMRKIVDQTGIVAQDRADTGRDAPSLSDANEMSRNFPHQHGGEVASESGAEGGLRGDHDLSDSADHGGRKRN